MDYILEFSMHLLFSHILIVLYERTKIYITIKFRHTQNLRGKKDGIYEKCGKPICGDQVKRKVLRLPSWHPQMAQYELTNI